jgi:hypothetical protein
VEATEPTATTLEYAPGPPPNRRRLARRVAWAVVLVAIALAAWRWGPPHARQARLVYWQSQCMSFHAPAGHPAYEDDPVQAAALAQRPDYRPAVAWRSTGNLSTPPTGQPVAYVPRPLANMRPGTTPVVFMAGRTTPAGAAWLVTIEAQVFLRHDGSRGVRLRGINNMPHSLRPGRQPRVCITNTPAFSFSPRDRLQLYWGQRDPRVGRRFTIGYRLNDAPGTIEGWLLDDGGVEFFVLDGPLLAQFHHLGRV